ncbi:hypothetical protein J1614_003248 [Plenodomus biglobosus]|nr:hypothetical protein J1614_003248 [Plenodomus biglobosus]
MPNPLLLPIFPTLLPRTPTPLTTAAPSAHLSSSHPTLSPPAILAITAAIILLLLSIPLLATLLRRRQRNRLLVPTRGVALDRDAVSSRSASLKGSLGASSSKGSLSASSSKGSLNASSKASTVSEDRSLKSILVTREVQRESVRVERPGRVYEGEKGWGGVEVWGGGLRSW